MAGRYGGATADASLWKAFNKGLDLLSSDAIDSDKELLDLVKKAKQDLERGASQPPKKIKSGRGGGEMEQQGSSPCLGSVLPLSDHCGAESLGSASEVNPNTVAGSGGSLLTGHAQARLLHSSQSCMGRGRIEKPRRKMNR
ncbi:hypothetical protein O6H91_09G052700 [Diphasiastrum complanatum]|uniref:Uncharacterized protein n=1 Tax=Diphasiastrum complanatum TaxID=34168 RepID=A0ACC2CPE1_DIPCM|nr:hypothetical protein O6H91_09G052700 [Diphasiastrum complanatum]